MRAIEKHFSADRYELFTGHLSEKNLSLYEKLGYNKFKTETTTGRYQLLYLEKQSE